MSEWNSGYNVDLGYTYGFYREMAPEWLNYCALVQGVVPPQGQWRYLELGCGQGVGLTLLAALNPAHEFVGVDFNPLHIAHARKLAAAAGVSNVRFEEADFIELAQDWPKDWGRFDYVAAHGIFTWISLVVRRGLVGTIDKATKPGALVYLSYNTLPGWIATYPVQHLMRLWQTSEEMPSVNAIETGMERLKALVEVKTPLTESLPGMHARIEQMARLDRSYLVQEYLHDGWHPVWFDEVADQLADAKLNYVGTAAIADFYVPQLLPQNRKEILNQYQNPVVRQVMLDVLVNQSFRRDIFARGNQRIWPVEQRRELTQCSFALAMRPKPEDGISFRLSIGEVNGKSEVYSPLLDALESGPKTLEELMAQPGPSPRGFIDTLQCLSMMMSAGHISLNHPAPDGDAVRRLNRAIATAVADGAPYRYMIAGKTGAVMTAGDVEMLFLSFLLEDGEMDLDLLAGKAVDRLLLLGKTLVKDGTALTNRETMLPYARELAEQFTNKTLPRWRTLGVL
jgi:SAM-dependent methyltransferase